MKKTLIILLAVVLIGVLTWKFFPKIGKTYVIYGTITSTEGPYVRFTVKEVLVNGKPDNRKHLGERFVTLRDDTPILRYVSEDDKSLYDNVIEENGKRFAVVDRSELARYAEVVIYTKQDMYGEKLMIADRVEIGTPR